MGEWLYDKRNKFFNKSNGVKKEKPERLEDNEVQQILAGATNIQDKCWISLLASQGFRPSELLNMKPEDIKNIENGVEISVVGKTGHRVVYVYENWVIPHLHSYLAIMPKDQTYLFPFTLTTLNKRLRKVCEKQGIKKRVHAYKFRKYSVTRDRISKMSTPALESKFGWVKGTQVIRVYDKSIPKDYQDEIKARHGLLEDKQEDRYASKKCLRCEEINSYDKTFCGKCGLNLDTTKEELVRSEGSLQNQVKALQEQMSKFNQFVTWLENNSQVRKLIEEQASIR